MPTITDIGADGPAPPPDTLRVLIDALRSAEPHLVILVVDPPADLPECWYCDPTGLVLAGCVIVTWRNRFGRFVTRSACRADVSVAFTEGSSDGTDMVVRVPVTAGHNALTDQPLLPLVGADR